MPAVCVNHSLQPNSRWFIGSGIYRNVYLLSTSSVCLASWGVFAHAGQFWNDFANVKRSIHAIVVNHTERVLCAAP